MDELLERALELFASKGPTGLTIRELAAALDYTPGALYRYVKSKDELLVRVQLRALERIAAGLRAAMDRRDPLEAVVAGAVYYLELPDTRPLESALMQFLIGDPRVLLAGDEAEAVARPLASVLAEVAAVIARGQQSGVLGAGDAGERAVALWAAIQGASSLRKFQRLAPQLDARAIAMQQVAALLSHWGADAEAVARAMEVRS